jgi:hypothetical protein
LLSEIECMAWSRYSWFRKLPFLKSKETTGWSKFFVNYKKATARSPYGLLKCTIHQIGDQDEHFCVVPSYFVLVQTTVLIRLGNFPCIFSCFPFLLNTEIFICAYVSFSLYCYIQIQTKPVFKCFDAFKDMQRGYLGS